MFPERRDTFDAVLSKPIRSAIGRLTTAASAGLIQIKGVEWRA
jgi:hypothetical protein